LQLSAQQVDSAAALVGRAGGRVLSSNPAIYIVELAGTELEIGKFIAGVGAYGEIIEVVRSGVLGIARGNPRMHLVK
jgi:acetolactate synthase small subunit